VHPLSLRIVGLGVCIASQHQQQQHGVNTMDRTKLVAVLSYVVQSEYNHYLESDHASDHVYVKALECLNALLNEKGQGND